MRANKQMKPINCMPPNADVLDFVDKLSKDLKNSAKLLDRSQVRYLVDCYYQLQDFRIAADSQRRNAQEEEKEADVVTFPSWLATQLLFLENQIKAALMVYAKSNATGEWLLSICGIGPVISAGLLAMVDPEKTKAVSSLWKYAGLDPTSEWKKGEKPPWNLSLKTLCSFKIGESFVKVQNNEKDFYGKIYADKKKKEIALNESGAFGEQAEAKLKKFKIGKTTDAYKAYIAGKLPPAHIHARARRYAVKLFLSHFLEVYHYNTFKTPLPNPWVIEHGGHKDKIDPPNWDKPSDV